MISENFDLSGTSILSVLSRFSGYHEKKRDLCRRLEDVADSLPDNVDRQEILTISLQILPVVCEAHQFEEATVFPLLAEAAEQTPEMLSCLERLHCEHMEDESTAEDISAGLQQLITDPEKVNTDKISYMLRGFFESVRRHIAFEEDHLIPIIRSVP